MPTLRWIRRSKGSTSAASGGTCSSDLSGRSAEAVPDTVVFTTVVPAVSSKQSAEARSHAEILVDFQRLIEQARPDGGQKRKRKMSPSAKAAMVAEKKSKATAMRDLPTGVYKKSSTGRFESKIQWGSKSRYIGIFDTPEQASAVYTSLRNLLNDVELSVLGADEVTTLFKAAQKKAVESFVGLVPEERVLPTGVSKKPSGKFHARLQWGDKQHSIGTFDTPEQASAAYALMRKERDDVNLLALGADEVVILFNAAQRKAVEAVGELLTNCNG